MCSKTLRLTQEVGRKNMNAQEYNDHVSFYASQLALSPCGKMLLVSTEGARIIVYRVKGAALRVYFRTSGF